LLEVFTLSFFCVRASMQTDPDVSTESWQDVLRAELRIMVQGDWREELRKQLSAQVQGELREELRKQLTEVLGQKPHLMGQQSHPGMAPIIPEMVRQQTPGVPPAILGNPSPLKPPLLERTGGSFVRTTSHGLSGDDDAPHEWRRNPRTPRTRTKSMRAKAKPTPLAPALGKKDAVRTSKKYNQLSVKLLPKHGVFSQDSAGCLLKFVESFAFHSFVGWIILANAITIGWQTDYMAINWTVKVPAFFIVTELIFTVLFSFELILRVAAHGKSFFIGPDWQWNLFDAGLIMLQVIEQIAYFIVYFGRVGDSDISELTDGTSSALILRIFRLMRIFRLLRVVHLFSDLQAIFAAVTKSVRSFVWTLMLLFLLMYLVGVLLTQIVTDHKVAFSQAATEGPLEDYYGSLMTTILGLFQAISGGKEWRDALEPLMEHIAPWLALPYCMYIAFVAFALLNIMTGTFVDKALEGGKDEKRRILLKEVHAVFKQSEQADISTEAFEAQLNNPHMQGLLEALDVEEEDALELFHLLDTDHDGRILSEEFVNGCLRLDGAAKAVDLAAFTEEYRRLSRTFLEQSHFVNSSLTWLMQMMSSADPISAASGTSPQGGLGGSSPSVRRASATAVM